MKEIKDRNYCEKMVESNLLEVPSNTCQRGRNPERVRRIIAPSTSQIKKKNQPTHCYFVEVHGLIYPSMVCLEQIRTIDKSRVIRYIGRLTSKQMREVDEAYLESLGMTVPETVETP